MNIENLFISCGSNTVNNGIVYLNNVLHDSILVAYTSHNMIALVNFSEKRLEYTLIGHTKKVTNLTAYQNPIHNYSEIVSSGEDGIIVVWRHYNNDPLQKWIVQEKLQNLQGESITCHSSLYTNAGVFITASTCKSKLVTWFRSNDQSNNFATHEEIQFPSAQMPKTVTLMNCPHRGSEGGNNESNNLTPSVILAIGSVDSRVHLRLYNILLQQNPENNNVSFSTSTPIGNLTGHEDWVTCLSDPLYLPNKTIEKSTNLYFASGSQDSKIRIWKITPTTITDEGNSDTNLEQKQDQNILNPEEIDVVDDDDDEDDEQVEGNDETSAEVQIGVVSEENTGEARCAFTAAQIRQDSSNSKSDVVLYSVTLETLLVGHEDWVTSLHWMSSSTNTFEEDQSLRLFSTSMDRNMVIWSPDPSDGIWVPSIRIGDIGGNLGGSVGGNLLGFVGGCTFITKNTVDARKYTDHLMESIIGIGYGGSFHLWQRVLPQSTNDVIGNDWAPKSFLTGHFDSISDVSWSNCPSDENSPSNNEFIVTVSVDQTCRLFAPICNHPSPNIRQLWCELSRPQIHGYDLSSLQFLPFHTTPFSFFSAGDEKAIRSFEAPWVVLEGLSTLAGNTAAKELLQGKDGSNKRVQSAYIPELGLSNRASNLMTGDELKEQDSRGVDAVEWNNPPLEGQLADKTIWPEINKLHGHKSDVVCLSASNCGNWLATAAKGRDTKSSVILIWELKRMVCLTSLLGHESTVTALSFSPNSRYLISGGKDRSILLHECFHLNGSADNTSKSHQHSFTPRAFLKNAHKRIIWDLTWIGDSGNYFSTASRDGSVKVWKVIQDQASSTTTVHQELTFNPFEGTAVTSIDSTKQEVTWNGVRGWFLIVGSENGNIQIWFLSSSNSSNESAVVISHVYSVPDFHIHGATVRKIKWKESAKQSELKFASCGDDHSVRIFRFVWQ